MRNFFNIGGIWNNAINIRPDFGQGLPEKSGNYRVTPVTSRRADDCIVDRLPGIFDIIRQRGDVKTGILNQFFSIAKMYIFVYNFIHRSLGILFVHEFTYNFFKLGDFDAENIKRLDYNKPEGIMLDNLLSTFKIQYWYHVFVILGCVGIIAALIFDFKGIANKDALLLFFGIMLIGVGEWINHPLQTKIVRPNAYTPGGGIITGYPRKNVFLGVLFDLGGFILCGAAFYKIYNSG
jgi:hypothetical protein